ncbi:MAG: hypothetical protein JRG67_16205 [Deltaproteobacteria bacterium]|nr:hypothetical protein [Deltaproteobacteria bacterium]
MPHLNGHALGRVDADPFCAGDQAPIAEATAAGLNNCDWYYDGVRQAVAAQPGTPHQVSILDGAGHVPTHDVGSGRYLPPKVSGNERLVALLWGRSGCATTASVAD